MFWFITIYKIWHDFKCILNFHFAFNNNWYMIQKTAVWWWQSYWVHWKLVKMHTGTAKVNSQKLSFKVSWSHKKGYEIKQLVNNWFMSTTSLLFYNKCRLYVPPCKLISVHRMDKGKKLPQWFFSCSLSTYWVTLAV